MIDVLVDTGSAGLGVPIIQSPDWPNFETLSSTKAGASLILCDDLRCRGNCDSPKHEGFFCGPHGGTCVHMKEAAEEQQGGRDVCSFSWKYGDNSTASGVVMRSQVDLGGIVVNSTWGAITNTTGLFYESPRGGGIMGISFGQGAMCQKRKQSTCFSPLFDDLMQQGPLDNRFSICANKRDAKLILGGSDDRLYQGQMKYVPFIAPHDLYLIEIKKVTLGGQDITPPVLYHGQQLRGWTNVPGVDVALVDTGTSAVRVPEEMFMRFNETLVRMAPELLDPALNIFAKDAVPLPDTIFDKLPDLVFYLDCNVTISYTPKDYIQAFAGPTSAVNSTAPLYSLVLNPGKNFIFGQIALQKLYLEFDRGNKQLGIALSQPRCEPVS